MRQTFGASGSLLLMIALGAPARADDSGKATQEAEGHGRAIASDAARVRATVAEFKALVQGGQELGAAVMTLLDRAKNNADRAEVAKVLLQLDQQNALEAIAAEAAQARGLSQLQLNRWVPDPFLVQTHRDAPLAPSPESGKALADAWWDRRGQGLPTAVTVKPHPPYFQSLRAPRLSDSLQADRDLAHAQRESSKVPALVQEVRQAETRAVALGREVQQARAASRAHTANAANHDVNAAHAARQESDAERVVSPLRQARDRARSELASAQSRAKAHTASAAAHRRLAANMRQRIAADERHRSSMSPEQAYAFYNANKSECDLLESSESIEGGKKILRIKFLYRAPVRWAAEVGTHDRRAQSEESSARALAAQAPMAHVAVTLTEQALRGPEATLRQWQAERTRLSQAAKDERTKAALSEATAARAESAQREARTLEGRALGQLRELRAHFGRWLQAARQAVEAARKR